MVKCQQFHKSDDSKHTYFISTLTGNEYSASTLCIILAVDTLRLFLLLRDF